MRKGQALTARAVVRWYTSISCGLSSAQLAENALARLDGVVQRVNSPPLNLRQAIEGTAKLHFDLLAEPVFPGFGGILARLLLACQLGRCGLPPVLFDPARDRHPPADSTSLLQRLLDRVQRSCDALLTPGG